MINKDTVKHLAKLSRLRFCEQDLDLFAKNLDEIFQYANSLQKIDTKDIEASSQALPLQNVFKEDIVVQYVKINELINNGPDVENNSFKVPRILTQ
jgi:aspartyl-tRNA(Asn)/glutamyl-tRNA(Gln) amidotransferase subunit C